jgi:hypothetical protein
VDVGVEGGMDVGEAAIELDDTAGEGDDPGSSAPGDGEPPPHPESASIATTAKARRRALTGSLRT